MSTPGGAKYFQRPITAPFDAHGFPQPGPLPDDIIEQLGFGEDIDTAPGLTVTVVRSVEGVSESGLPDEPAGPPASGEPTADEPVAPGGIFASPTIPAPATSPAPIMTASGPAFPPPEDAFNLPDGVGPEPFGVDLREATQDRPTITDDDATGGGGAVPPLMDLDQMRAAMRTPAWHYQVDEKKILCRTCKHAFEAWVVMPVQSQQGLFFAHIVRCVALSKRNPIDVVGFPVYSCNFFKPGRPLLPKPQEIVERERRLR